MSPSCQKPTEEQWLHYKAQIRYWYLVEEMQLGKIVDQLINLGFTVTINELHYKLNKKWKFRKNIDKDTWVKIDHRISKRKREGKDSEVIYCGKRLKPETVKKETDRHRDMSIFAQLVSRQPPSPQVPTDALISICTPPSLSIDVKEIEWPRTLPWLNFPAKELRALLPTHMKSQYNEEILPEALISFTCGGQNRLRINELGVSKLAAIIGMSIPESYPDEQLQRAQYLLSGSPEEKLYEYLSIVLYGLSNNSHDLNKKENWQAMMVILKASGLLEIKSYPKRLKSWTIEAFMEKLFLTAIKRLFNPDFDDVDSITVIKWLLNLGQNPNVAATTIWYRIEGCRSRSAVREMRFLKIMEHILEAGVDSNFMVYDGVALETIVSNWSKGVAIPMTRLLLKHGASFNIENALSLAIEREDRELIEMFLQYSSSTNLDRALHSAIKTKDRALIDLISQHGADPIAEIECTFGFVYKATALSVAAATGLWETQYILGLLASRNPYRLIAEYITADVLISAAAAGQYDTVCLLCRESPGVVANHFGITPLHAAICHGHLNICEFLISMYDEYTSDIVPTVTSLHVACYYWQEHIVRFLVRCGADVDAIARFSHTTEENNTVSRLLPAFNYSRRYTSKLYAVTPLDMIFANNKSFTTAAADCATVLINAGAKPSGREVDLAAMHAHLDLLSSCLAAGADPNKGHEDKCSALQVILSSSFLQWMSDVRWMRDRHYCFVELLLKSGAVLRGGEIISAIRLKMWDFVDLLLRYDGKLSDTDTSGTTALEEAIWSQYNPLITRIFETTPGIYDAGSLCAAMETQQKSIEQRLLANRCAESVGSDLEVTAIGIAAESGDFNLLRTLLEYLPPHRCGPLPICVFNMRHRYLLRFHRFGYYGKGSIHSLYGSPLALLAFSEENSAIEACFELLKAGFQPDRLTWVVASSSNNAPFIQFLLDHGQRYNEIGDDDSIDYRLESPLSYAVENHNKNLVEMLLRAGADVNEHIMEPCSRSPLQRAVELGDLDLVRYLTEAGANINSPSAYQFGATALQFAAIKGHIVIAKYLLDHGAEVNASPAEKGGRTALEGAAEMGRLDMLGLLLAKGAKKTGDDCHRHFIRAVKRAMKEGHYIAANLLKHSLGWSEEDEGMFQAVQLDDEGVIIE